MKKIVTWEITNNDVETIQSELRELRHMVECCETEDIIMYSQKEIIDKINSILSIFN